MHQAIARTNVGLSDVFCGIHLRAISNAFCWMKSFVWFAVALKFALRDSIDNKLALIQVMACYHQASIPESMMTKFCDTIFCHYATVS